MCRTQSVNSFINLPLQYITACMPFVNNQVTSIRFTTYISLLYSPDVMNNKTKDPYRFDGGGKESG
jgi:hypothetical protein